MVTNDPTESPVMTRPSTMRVPNASAPMQQTAAVFAKICYRLCANRSRMCRRCGIEVIMFGTNIINDQETELARLIIDTLNLDFDLGEAGPDTPLYNDGFGLDSIDILEVALAVAQRYGVKLRSDDENNVAIFSSLRSLSDYIQAHRTK